MRCSFSRTSGFAFRPNAQISALRGFDNSMPSFGRSLSTKANSEEKVENGEAGSKTSAIPEENEDQPVGIFQKLKNEVDYLKEFATANSGPDRSRKRSALDIDITKKKMKLNRLKKKKVLFSFRVFFFVRATPCI